MNALKRLILSNVIAAAENKPEQWSFDVWGGARNSDLNVEVNELTGIMDLEIRAPGGVTIGGINFFGFLIPWRWRLWLALRRARVLSFERATGFKVPQ